MKNITIKIEEEACKELERWTRYYRGNITEPESVRNIRRARKTLCKALNISYDTKDEIT